MGLPGWNSLDATSRLHSVFEIAGIVLLGLLVLAETLAYQYGHRSNDLLALQQDTAQKKHDEEIARLHRDTAALTADAEKSRALSADANARAVQAQLALEQLKAPRGLTDQQVASVVAAVKPYAGQEFGVTTYWDMKEPLAFANGVAGLLERAGWKFIPPTQAGFLLGGTEGVEVWIHPAADEPVKRAAEALIKALTEAGIAAVKLKTQNPENPKTNQIALNIGTKPQ